MFYRKPKQRSAQGHERGTLRSRGGHMVQGPGDRRCRPQSTPRVSQHGKPEGWGQGPTRCRPMVGKQTTFRNSSLRGSIPKGSLEGGQADPPQKPPGAADRLVCTLSKVHGLSKAARQKFGGRSRVPCKWTRRARQKFGERSRVPLLGRPRRGRTSPPVGDRPHWASLW